MTLGFKAAFVPAITAGTKPHTIRHGSRWGVGMSIQFYQNVRQKSMAKFRPDGVARVVQDIYISKPDVRLAPQILVSGRILTPLECQELSRRDGFDDFAQLLVFFKTSHGLPFAGQLVGWTDLRY